MRDASQAATSLSFKAAADTAPAAAPAALPRWCSGPSSRAIGEANFSSAPRRLFSLFFAFLLSFVSHLPLVRAEPFATSSTALHTALTAPDWSNPRITLSLVILVGWTPIAIVTVVMIWFRRARFPLAGRGVGYLMVLGIKQILNSAILCVLSIFYPVGAPCGMQFLLYLLLSAPGTTTYLLRGITLVFRMEIMNFLAETRWREEKRAMLRSHQEKMAELAAAEGGATDAAETKLGGTATETKLSVDDEPDDPETIPGYFFLQHRRWIEPVYMFKWVSAFCTVIALVLLIVCAFDPDIHLTDVSFRERGLLGEDETTGSQFSPDNFATAPVCLVYSIKMLMFQILLAISLFPGSNWCVRRLRLDEKRQKARRAEQEEVHRLVYGEEMPVVPKIGGVDLDDPREVKIELFMVQQLVTISNASYYPVQLYEPGWSFLLLVFVNIAMFLPSFIRPLYTSFVVQRKLREHVHQNGSMSSKSSKGRVVPMDRARRPHQQPYYTLRFILRNPQTYPVLLTFLQKEFSSENAMFYSEAREFEQAAKSLESRIPGWPNGHDDEDTGNTRTGRSSQHLLSANSGGGKRANGLATVGSKLDTITDVGPGGMPLMVRLSSVGSTTASSALEPMSTLMTTAHASTVMSSALTPVHASKWPAVAPAPTLTPMTESTTAQVQGSPSALFAPNGHLEFPLVAPSTSNASLLSPDPATISALRAEADRLKTWAKKISDEYLHRSAIYEINIPEDISKLVLSQMAQLDRWQPTPADLPPNAYPVPPPFPLSSLLKQTQVCVFDLIQRDSFRRFILTSDFARLLQQADEEELARLEKQGDIAIDAQAALDRAMAQSTLTPSGPRPIAQRSPSGPKAFALSNNKNSPITSILAGDDRIVSLQLPGVPSQGEAATRSLLAPASPARPKRQSLYSRVDEEPHAVAAAPTTSMFSSSNLYSAPNSPQLDAARFDSPSAPAGRASTVLDVRDEPPPIDAIVAFRPNA